MEMPGSACSNCGADASITESPMAVTFEPGIRTVAARCAARGAARAAVTRFAWVAALTFAPCVICRCKPADDGASMTPYPAVPTTLSATTMNTAGKARPGDRRAEATESATTL